MAEKKSPDSKSLENGKKASAPKKKSSMRESAAKSRVKAEKPKRVRKAAGAAKKPVKSVTSALTKEFHLIGNHQNDKFMTKSRKVTPNYFRSAWAEMKLVTWPGRKETWRLVFAVFAFALVMGTVIAVLDYGLDRIMRQIIL